VKIGIIGHGFVGQAVSNAFTCGKIIVDPLQTKTTIDDMLSERPECVFICVPTPSNPDGSVDGSLVKEAIESLPDDLLIIVKSTVTPDYLDYPNKRLVYNPEFLTQRTANSDFINPDFMVFGGREEDCDAAYRVFNHSNVRKCPVHFTDIATASLVKYTLNSLGAAKVIFMNEIFNLHARVCQSDWESFKNILLSDPRVGPCHLDVPGPDGQFGFGGACFPKDTKALIRYAHENDVLLSVLLQAVRTNEIIRNA
jgi:UDPglucose 6-dehydrogenase